MDKEIKKDEWGIVLDFLSQGLSSMMRSEPVAQIIGDQFFSLLEIILRDDITMAPHDRIYIGEGKRDQVKYIRGRVEYDALTSSAKQELEPVITSVIEKDPKRFVDFFNTAGPITTRMHQLELLPGVGKKHLWAIIDARKEKPFESFADIKKRVSLLPDPEKLIIRRVVDELQDSDKYRIFVPRMEAHDKRR